MVLCPTKSSSRDFIKTRVETVANTFKLRKFMDGKCRSSLIDDDELHTGLKYQNQEVMTGKLPRRSNCQGGGKCHRQESL